MSRTKRRARFCHELPTRQTSTAVRASLERSGPIACGSADGARPVESRAAILAGVTPAAPTPNRNRPAVRLTAPVRQTRNQRRQLPGLALRRLSRCQRVVSRTRCVRSAKSTLRRQAKLVHCARKRVLPSVRAAAEPPGTRVRRADWSRPLMSFRSQRVRLRTDGPGPAGRTVSRSAMHR